MRLRAWAAARGRFVLRVVLTILVDVLALLVAYADAAVLPETPALATVDLATADGLRTVAGTWRYSDAKVSAAAFRSAGTAGQPTGDPVETYDIVPHAGAAGFDDSEWQMIAPESLSQRRGNGRLSFNWYRLSLTVPARVGSIDVAGTTAVFETSVDDYAEIWVDGEITRAPQQSGGSVIAGWNATNRVIAARHVHPGQNIVIAVFGANGPLSNPPTNFIYMRSARLSFHASAPGAVAMAPAEANVEVIRNDPALDEIVSANPKLFKLAEGFEFTEGPVWVAGDGYLLFSDPNSNIIYKYRPDGDLSVFRRSSGYEGADIAEYHQPGSNGLAIDREGRLVVDEHGRRRVSRVEKDGTVTVLAASYGGKRLNSPNDLVLHSDGSIYFTDPPFGLPKAFDDPRKELAFSGVYRISDGRLDLLVDDLTGPNGIAFSPDEKFLYVGDWDEKKKVVMRYPVLADGKTGAGEVFFDMTSAPGEDAIDGIEVDVNGNLYVSGPGALWILSPSGRHLGSVVTPQHVHNMAWGGDDAKTLYLCARGGLYRMPMGIAGVRR
ncbi:MAG TPA: SMP-30/gluconolactonase/LRE family protein [Candidatus Limnocylindrales bacterium]|nr:SMP-30/gluconolactonase/LRE family protein [Candidatus Limnocylindrales bacterium]